jgi:PAS domain S-box-containing protein
MTIVVSAALAGTQFMDRQGVPAWMTWAGFSLTAGLAGLGLFVLALRKLVVLRTSELKDALASLGESEQRFRSTFEQAAVGIAHKDLDGRWLLVNQKLCDILGYTRKEMIGHSFRDITHPDDLDKDLDSLVLLRDGNIPMYSLEKRYLRKDGGLVWVDLTASLAPGERDGPPYVITVIQDISERKRVERELEKARQYIRNIINSMPSVVIGVDDTGRVTHYNPSAARLLAHPVETAVGDPLGIAFPAYASQMEAIHQAIKDRVPALLERQPSMIGGEIRFQDVLIYPLVANGVEGAVLRIDDVTERVRLTEMMVQTEKMMSVGGLAAGMAHEINNPLGAILQSAQVIQRHVDPGVRKNKEVALECGCTVDAIWDYLSKRKVPDFLDGIREAGSRAAKIVANMLEFSRRSESRREPVAVSEVLDNSVALASSDYDLKKKFDFRHIDIVRDYDPGVPPAYCSRTEIEQVFLNLLKNAAQAMSLKRYVIERPTITLRTARVQDKVSITVEDNGPGMEEAVRKRVFEPFFTTKEPGQGTGLGLSVSYFIIASNHGGNISVESTPGSGTRFTIELPVAPAGAEHAYEHPARG